MSETYVLRRPTYRPGEVDGGAVARSLLHLDSSASRSRDSVSRQLTGLFADTWRGRRGDDRYDYRYRDLAADPVPLISPGFVSLGRRAQRHGPVPLAVVPSLVRGDDEAREWGLTLPLINELLAADTVLLGVPMYNFTVPAALKAWIDRITFPGAFTDPGTGQSLLERTKVVVVEARGGCYRPGTPREGFEFQARYLRAYFTDLGVREENLHFVCAEMTRAADNPALARFRSMGASSLAAARSAVTALAARLPDGEA